MHDGILELFRIQLEGNDTCAMHAGGQVLERDAATYLTHEARAVKHYIKMSMGKPLLELEPGPPRPAPPPTQLPVPNLAALFTGPVLL